MYLEVEDDIGEGSLLVGVKVKRSQSTPLVPATGLLMRTGESQVESDEILITSLSILPLIFSS